VAGLYGGVGKGAYDFLVIREFSRFLARVLELMVLMDPSMRSFLRGYLSNVGVPQILWTSAMTYS